jgi:hypothetical protein
MLKSPLFEMQTHANGQEPRPKTRLIHTHFKAGGFCWDLSTCAQLDSICPLHTWIPGTSSTAGMMVARQLSHPVGCCSAWELHARSIFCSSWVLAMLENSFTGHRGDAGRGLFCARKRHKHYEFQAPVHGDDEEASDPSTKVSGRFSERPSA